MRIMLAVDPEQIASASCVCADETVMEPVFYVQMLAKRSECHLGGDWMLAISHQKIELNSVFSGSKLIQFCFNFSSFLAPRAAPATNK